MSSPPKSEYHDTASSTPAYNTPPALIAFTLTVLILCFVAFSIVCLCKYCFSSVIHTWAFQRTPSGSLIRVSPDRSPHVWGLDPTLLEGFPTFLYSSVKDLRKEKSYSLECAICLLEFEDDSMLRLLTLCCHVFHQDCIDLWLRSHKTCPVCRTDLDSPPIPKSAGEDNNDNAQEGSRVSDIRIDVREGEGSCVDGDQIGGEHEHEYQRQEEHRLARSHSTGHSIVLIREGDEERDIDDKYTLRLPEHVIRGGHNCTRSCVTYNEIMTERPAPCSNCGFVQPLSQSSSLAHAPQS